MTGTARRNTEPHQNCSRRSPPRIGPITPPAENAETQMPDRGRALPGFLEHHEDQRQRRRRDRRARDAQERAAGDQHLGRGGEGREDRGKAEGPGAHQEHPSPPDPVAERAHGDQEARDHEPVDVEDPEELDAARPQVAADRRHGQVEDRQVHDVEQAREREDGEAEPLAPTRVTNARNGAGTGRSWGWESYRRRREMPPARLRSRSTSRRSPAPTFAHSSSTIAAVDERPRRPPPGRRRGTRPPRTGSSSRTRGCGTPAGGCPVRRACTSRFASQCGRNRTGAGVSASGSGCAGQVDELGPGRDAIGDEVQALPSPLQVGDVDPGPRTRCPSTAPARTPGGTRERGAGGRPPRSRRSGLPSPRRGRGGPRDAAPTFPTAGRERGRPTGRACR